MIDPYSTNFVADDYRVDVSKYNGIHQIYLDSNHGMFSIGLDVMQRFTRSPQQKPQHRF